MKPKPASDCIVCQKQHGEIPIPGGTIYENDLIFISHALLYQNETEHYLGHIFLETKRHVADLADLTETEAQALGLYTARVARALMHVLGSVHVYSFVMGDGVPHVHVHIIGRYADAPREYWGAKVDEWPQAPKGDAEKIAALSEQIRTYFKGTF